MKRMRVLMGLAVVTGLVLGACGGGERTFTAGDLEGIAPAPGDAPASLEPGGEPRTGSAALSSAVVISPGIQRWMQDPENGFVDARSVIFLGPEGEEPYVGGLATVFENTEGAAEALRLVQEDVSRPYEVYDIKVRGAKSEPSEGLGSGGFFLDGEFVMPAGPARLSPRPGVAYLWRVGNLLLYVIGDEALADDVRALAQELDSRAS